MKSKLCNVNRQLEKAQIQIKNRQAQQYHDNDCNPLFLFFRFTE